MLIWDTIQITQGKIVACIVNGRDFVPQYSVQGTIYIATLSTELTVQTFLYPRYSVDSRECQQKIVSFKKTDYSHTLVASFTCDSNLSDLTLQVCKMYVQCASYAVEPL